MTRTGWAERYVEEFLSLPLVSEFVLRSPRRADGSAREVVDFLVLPESSGILISQKCQEDPARRDPEKATRWARKNAREAASQVCGALRTGQNRPLVCTHPRRGIVELPNGLPTISHGVVILEVADRVDLDDGDARSPLPLDFRGVPITYLSVNDFLNLAVGLRTAPELVEYLDRRRSLPLSDLRIIGAEKSLYEFYLLNDGSFAGCIGLADARIAVAAEARRLETILSRKAESDHEGWVLEHVADALATRNPDYAVDLPPQFSGAFDAPGERKNYLRMQSILAGLRLRERAELGKAFLSTMQSLTGDGFVYKGAWLESRPEWVYVFAASRSVPRTEVLSRVSILMRAAMAHYEKPECMVIVDRDGKSYEVAMARPGFKPSLAEIQAGHELFGRLRHSHDVFNLAASG